MNTQFTEDDARAMLTNPVYTGMGPYRAIVGDEQWLDANVRMIEEEGAQTVIESALKQFGGAFPGLQTPAARPYIRQAKRDSRVALRRLLTDLRDLAEEEKA